MYPDRPRSAAAFHPRRYTRAVSERGAPYLRAVSYTPEGVDAGYPFDLEILQAGLHLELGAPVAFLAGENGSGKSTLLESIAMALRCVAIGAHDLERDPTLEPARELAARLRIVRAGSPRLATFFRAEDAFGFTRRVTHEMATLEQLEAEFEGAFEDGSWGQRLAMGSARAQRQALADRYGEDPDAASHGESFLHLLEERLVPGGLYVLDEPETPLSPLRQLGLLHLLRDRVAQGCQFVVATHSPILLALPEAEIFWLEGTAQRRAWSELEHVVLLRSFLDAPERYLRRL